MRRTEKQIASRKLEAAFRTRTARALEILARSLPRKALADAVEAPSDLEVMVRALLAARGSLEVDRTDPLRIARLRGQHARLALLNLEGGTLSAAEVAELLGISRQAVNKRRQSGRLLALPSGRSFVYPAWQFADRAVLPGLVEVLEDLEAHDPWMQARFFLGREPRLGNARPLDKLRQGRVQAVRDAAATYGEQGAA